MANLPPNTLTNADGTPYAAGHESAIDRKKVMAHKITQGFASVLYAGFFQTEYAYLNGSWNDQERAHFRHCLMEHLEPGVLTLLKSFEDALG